MSGYDDWEDRTSIENEKYFGGDYKAEEGQDFEPGMEFKRSIKNYIFLHYKNSLIIIHPSNPTFDFIRFGGSVKSLQASYANSRKYGTFWVNKTNDKIIQCANYGTKREHILYDIKKGSGTGNLSMLPVEIEGIKRTIKDVIECMLFIHQNIYNFV